MLMLLVALITSITATKSDDASLQWVIQTNFPMRIFLDMNLSPYRCLFETWMQNHREFCYNHDQIGLFHLYNCVQNNFQECHNWDTCRIVPEI